MKKTVMSAQTLKLWLERIINVGVNLYAGTFKGNAKAYRPENIEYRPGTRLEGKTIIFLGSSVTLGIGAKNNSFVEYLAARDGVRPIKSAVGGTTLITQDETSYIPRMEALDPAVHADAFVCQLSTNDAGQLLPLGEIAEGFNRSDFDCFTVAGAIETIISYARETWICPIVFYTNPRYDNEQYGQMVELLGRIAEKWNISVIDLYSDALFNDISQEERALYMVDSIHPTMAGYRDWWLPRFEADLEGLY